MLGLVMMRRGGWLVMERCLGLLERLATCLDPLEERVQVDDLLGVYLIPIQIQFQVGIGAEYLGVVTQERDQPVYSFGSQLIPAQV